MLKSYRAETVIGLLNYFYFADRTLKTTLQGLIGYNSNKEYNRLGYFRGLFLSQLENLISLSYEEYSNTLLPPPFVTNCRFYSSSDSVVDDESIIDRGTCFESCIKNRTSEFFGNDIILPGIFVFDATIKKNPTMNHITVHELFSNQMLIELKNNLSFQCNKLCDSPTCFDTFYIPMLQSSTKFHTSVVMTSVMQSPKFDTISLPKLSFITYLTNILSTFGFWIGLSAFSAIEMITDSIFGYLRKRLLKNSSKGENVLEKGKLKAPDLGGRNSPGAQSCHMCGVMASSYEKHVRKIHLRNLTNNDHSNPKSLKLV